MKKTSLSLLLASIGFGIAGCSTLIDSQRDIRQDNQAAAKLMTDAREKATVGAVEIFDSQRFSGDEIAVIKKEVLPPIFDRPFLYATRSAPPREVIRAIAMRTGIPAVIAETSTTNSTSQAGTQALPAAAQGGTSLLSIFSGGPVTERPMELEWDRSLKSLLDHVANTMGLYWKYEDGRIRFFKEETRTFSINLPHGKKEVEATISLDGGSSGSSGGSSGSGSSGSSSGGSSGGGSVSVSSTQSIDPVNAIVSAVQAIVGGDTTSGATGPVAAAPMGGSSGGGSGNGKVVPSPELGMITVTAAPPVLDRVAAYVENVNKKFSKNILIDVTVYNVSLSKEGMAGISLDLNRALQKTFGQLGVSVTSPSMLGSISGGSSGGVVLDRTANGETSPSSTIVAKAMSGLGDVSLVRRGQVVAINGQPSPLQVGSSITYLASSATTQTEGAGTSASLIPGQAIVGMTANFLPSIMSDNRILLQYQLNISNLVGMDQVSSGGSMIQTPNISQQSLQQQAFLRDGQSLVLFGYDQDQSAQNSNASFSGFSMNADKKRQMTVIVMQVHTGGIN